MGELTENGKEEVIRLIELGVKFDEMNKGKSDKIRKHEWYTCLLSAEFDINSMSPDEIKDLNKRTKWLDKFTNSEYKYLFDKDSLSNIYIVRSRLKRKVRDWLMVISTLWSFDESLLRIAIKEAKEKYEEDTGRKFWLKEVE